VLIHRQLVFKPMGMIRGAVVDRRDPLGCQSKRSVCSASIGAAVRPQIGILADDEKNLDLVRAETAADATTQVDVLSVESQLVMDRTLPPPLREHLSVVHHALAPLANSARGQWTLPDFELARSAPRWDPGDRLDRHLPTNDGFEPLFQRPLCRH
jgi:hypothetical protein